MPSGRNVQKEPISVKLIPCKNILIVFISCWTSKTLFDFVKLQKKQLFTYKQTDSTMLVGLVFFIIGDSSTVEMVCK